MERNKTKKEKEKMQHKLIFGDCLEKMKDIPNESIDMILTDPPYGTTQCKWDSIVPLDLMWKELNRVIKSDGPIVLFGNEPFSSALRMSNIDNYKYDWVWDKNRGVGHLNAKRRPMMQTENIIVFYKSQPLYNPQMRDRDKPRISRNNATQEVWGKSKKNFVGKKLNKKYPINLITFSKSSRKSLIIHPTQKPVLLMAYLIKTYTNEKDTVLDFTCGSGSTIVACNNLNRIGIGIDNGYCEKDKIINDISIKKLSWIEITQLRLEGKI